MEVVFGLTAPPSWTTSAVAIGNFDGVHRGHRALVERARAAAARAGAKSVAVTFDPHPTAVVAPARSPALITTVARRLELLADTGVDAAVVLPFSPALAAMAADDFVDQVLRRGLGATHVVVGYDFGYGRGRAGSPATLREHGARAGFGVDVIEPIEVGGAVVSSTAIRDCLRKGDLPGARRLLGHAFDVDGVVVHGHKRGRELGFPTANVAPELPLLLGSGIYACRLAVQGGDALSEPLPAVASLGTNPTFAGGSERTLEVYVLDFSGDLYDRRVRVELVGKLRDEAKFDSLAALVEQIGRDVEDARQLLRAAPA
jgi:riboflavin kinase/FMN adenylyltransferase